MEKEDFKNLLTDLYQYYNPSKLKDIEMLSNKYFERQHEGIKTVFIIYNNKAYNPEKYNSNYGTESHIRFLINKYGEKDRVFSKEAFENKLKEKEDEVEKRKQEEDKKTAEKIEQMGDEVRANIEKAVADQVEKYFLNKKQEVDNKLNDLFLEKSKEIEILFEKKISEINSNVQSVPEMISEAVEAFQSNKSMENNGEVDIKLSFINFGENDIDLPGEEIMKIVSIGERMVVKDSNGKICGILIKDITWDAVSFDDKKIKDISIEKFGDD